MSEERKKSGAEKAVDRAEAKARAKANAALAAWLPLQLARLALAEPGRDVTVNVEVDAVQTLQHWWAVRT